MKKFTKILIALGAAGIAKYIYDHVDIVTNKELEERIKKEAEVIARETTAKKYNCESSILKPRDISIEEHVKQTWENLDKKGTGHYPIGSCDHVYYDNPYNISKIYLDKDGCPMVFEFENELDCKMALNGLLDMQIYDVRRWKWELSKVFDKLGLVIDDYDEFKDCFVCWEAEDLVKAQNENAIPNTINFGEFKRLVR